MTGDRWQHVEAVFRKTIECPPEERESVLAEACAGDVELRGEVESLLAHHEAADPDFLRPVNVITSPVSDEADPEFGVGERIGRYEIRGVISSGGMGVVYEAVQDRPRRTVALKVMRAGVASSSAMRRFSFEAELLARLQHPNIAQVYEAGVHERPLGAPGTLVGPPSAVVGSGPVPYFAMEFIPDALAITEYADHAELTTRQRLELFAQICDAVHHGHQKGIIHRDLKPNNILVDADGRVKIIDFGVSKCTDADLALTTMRTDVSELVGTLAYMSPEQCEGSSDLDIRSDVYALGVVLYELLCRRLPYDLEHESWVRKARVICEHPPIRPTQFDKKLRGDLEAMALKALEKDRERRYQSAEAFGEDVRRYLASEPIAARAPTAWNQVARWIVKNPIRSTGIACLVVIMLCFALTVGIIWVGFLRPQRIELIDEGREAVLVTAGGWELHRWNSQSTARLSVWEEIVDIPAGPFADERVVVLGYPIPMREFVQRGLNAFPVVGDPGIPLWSRQVQTNEMPELLIELEATPDSFGTTILLLDDIFPKHPGRELVVQHVWSVSTLTVFRIYGLEGKILFQFWHDGSAYNQRNSCYWMADAGLLLFAGINGEVPANERGALDAGAYHPLVLFAVRPEEEVIHRKFLRTSPDWGTVEPEWYRALEPMELLARNTGSMLTRPFGGADPGRTAWYHLILSSPDGQECTVWWEIDEFGKFVPGSLGSTNDYERHKEKLPPKERFHLGPLRPSP